MMRHPLIVVGMLAISAQLLAMRASATDYSTYSGADRYKHFCSACHGPQAQGDGPVSLSLNVAVPDLTRIAIRHGGVFPDEWVARVIDGRVYLAVHGARDMPVWGVALWAEQGGGGAAGREAHDLINRVVNYLKSLQVRH